MKYFQAILVGLAGCVLALCSIGGTIGLVREAEYRCLAPWVLILGGFCVWSIFRTVDAAMKQYETEDKEEK